MEKEKLKENRSRKGITGREVALIGVFLAVILVAGLLERLIPLDFIVPGARLGFSNIVILTSIYMFRFRISFLLVLLKCLLTAVMFGGLSSFIYSISGSFLSFMAMWLVVRFAENVISPKGISVIGAVFHSTGQVVTACVVLETVGILAYLPLLLALSIISGVLVGVVVGAVLPYLRRTVNAPVTLRADGQVGGRRGKAGSLHESQMGKKRKGRRVYNGRRISPPKGIGGGGRDENRSGIGLVSTGGSAGALFKLNRESAMVLGLLLVMVILSIVAAFQVSAAKWDSLSAEIYEDGVLSETLPMGGDEEFTIETARGYNRVSVAEGELRIVDADCPSQTCVHSGAINRAGEMIACLPHHLVIKIRSDGNSDVDVIAY